MGSYTKMLCDLAKPHDSNDSNDESVDYLRSNPTPTQTPLNSLKTEDYSPNLSSSMSPLGTGQHLSSPALGLNIPGFSQKNQNDKAIADELKKLFGSVMGHSDLNRITD